MTSTKKRLLILELVAAGRMPLDEAAAPPSRDSAAVPTRAHIVADRARRANCRRCTTMTDLAVEDTSTQQQLSKLK
jgi:hypothetical protein